MLFPVADSIKLLKKTWYIFYVHTYKINFKILHRCTLKLKMSLVEFVTGFNKFYFHENWQSIILEEERRDQALSLVEFPPCHVEHWNLLVCLYMWEYLYIWAVVVHARIYNKRLRVQILVPPMWAMLLTLKCSSKIFWKQISVKIQHRLISKAELSVIVLTPNQILFGILTEVVIIFRFFLF